MWVKDGDPSTIINVMENHTEEQRRFAGSRLTYNISVSESARTIEGDRDTQIAVNIHSKRAVVST
jgi:hypothetical protein